MLSKTPELTWKVLKGFAVKSRPGRGDCPNHSPLSHPSSLQPLFPGANELDQISKIHDVIGTPAEKTLTKFKQ